MTTFKFNFQEPTTNIFSDNAKKGTGIRNFNIEVLENLGFIDCGVYSTSGDLRVCSFKKQPAITFGKECNSGGKYAKYNTLVKVYKTESERNDAFVKLTAQLKQA